MKEPIKFKRQDPWPNILFKDLEEDEDRTMQVVKWCVIAAIVICLFVLGASFFPG